MELYFLGTSLGVPTKTRNVSAVALQESQGKGWFLVDCGEATQHQLLHTSLTVNNLRAILITHLHGDHCYGLPGLLASAAMNHRTEPLTIIAPQGVKEWLEATQRLTGLYLPYPVEFIATETMQEVTLGQFTIDVTALTHRVPSFAYRFTESQIQRYLDFDKLAEHNIPRGPIWGRLVKEDEVPFGDNVLKSEVFTYRAHEPRKVIIAGDNSEPDKLKSLSKHCHVLVHESTYSKELASKAKEYGHSYGELVARFASGVGIPNLVLTHFSSRYQTHPQAINSIEQIRQEAQSVYSGALFLAEDFARYRLDKSGVLKRVEE
ncbi:ribonuclease Z [Vibrio nereis]|uniref:Ribonuclease Z n=1 Tax=Vibrio nereis TaxID=693 RepID=A0A0M0HNA2_VIBNE|nr:ribonuclease Z [Vibrio nereis]KOO03317.1 beta-lactamase [Vibrio nereis]